MYGLSQDQIPRRRALLAGLLAAALGTAGCGGGGGGGGGATQDTLAVAGTPQAAAAAEPGAITGPIIPGPGGVDGGTAFSQSVYPLLTQYCTQCHAGGGPGFPHIAHPDVGTAYRAVVDNQKVNFTFPENSRLVQRLISDRHFCWSDCTSDGATMQAAVEQMASLIAGSGGGQAAATSTGTIMADGTISSATSYLLSATRPESGRDDSGIIALWRFKRGEGDIAYDTSPVGPPMDLTLSNATWLSGGGIEFAGNGIGISNPTASRKLWNEIASGSGSQAYSIEIWLTPANTSQDGPSRIVTYANGTRERNFTVAQLQYNYVYQARNLSPTTDDDGRPALQTADEDEDLQAVLHHAVFTYSQSGGRAVWVNGEWTEDVDEADGDTLINWHPDYTFAVGNETSNNRPWSGQIRMIAIYDRTLGVGQIRQNYEAGALDRFVLKFSLDTLVPAGTYVQFEVSEYDDYSYLFCFPRLVTPSPDGSRVAGLRIAVNGVAPVASQSFRTVDTVMDSRDKLLSSACAVMPKDLGAATDAFAVWFEYLGPHTDPLDESPPVIPPDNSVAAALPDIGIRSFVQANDTMSELTGVPATTANVASAFATLKEQLPATTDVRTFVAANQVANANLSLEYCDALVESATLRQAFFGTQFDFDANVVTAFAGQAERDRIIDPLIERMIGVNLTNQPTAAEVEPELETLIDTLTAGCDATSCDATRTRTVVKAVCAAVLSSAALTVH